MKNEIKFEDYNGWSNRDTWLVMLWLNNDAENYININRIIANSNKLKDYSNLELYAILKDFNYGDEINFTNVNLAEIRTALTEE